MRGGGSERQLGLVHVSLWPGISACPALCLCVSIRARRSPGATLRSRSSYLRDGDFDKGLDLLDKGRGVVDRETDTEWYWRLRFLHAEILIEQNRSKDALSLLDIDGLTEARYPPWPLPDGS